MKRIMFSLMLLSVFIFTACSEDDKETGLDITVDNLVGTWNYDKGTLNGVESEIVDELAPSEMKLNADMTMSSGTTTGTWDLVGTEFSFELVNYVYEENESSTTTYTDTTASSFNIDEVTNSTLQLSASEDGFSVKLNYIR